MFYNFICQDCNTEEEKQIAIKDYDAEKEKQVCSVCGGKMTRKIEWQGVAEGSGDGWFGKNGSRII